MLSTILELVGLAVGVLAAWLVAPVLGLAVAAVSLLAVGVAMESR